MCTSKFATGRWSASVCVSAVLLLGAASARADRFPSGCGLPSGSGDASSASIAANANIVRVGQVVEYKVSLQNPTTDNFGDPACSVTDAHVTLRLPNGAVLPILTNIALNPGDPSVVCPGDVRCQTTTVGPSGFGYPYTVSMADITNISFVSSCPLPPGPTPAIIASTDGGALVRNSDAGFGSASYLRCRPLKVNLPCIACAKSCVNGVGENGSITFSGTITNCGNSLLVGITVSDAVNGGSATVTPVTNALAPGATTTFSGSYVPANPCVPTTDTITVSGTDFDTAEVVTSTCSATCSNVITPCITVTKNCDTVVIGSANTVSGVVSNCGNVTITNISITDNIYGQLATVASLAPGASQSYSKLVTNSCGSFPNTVSANGTTTCGQPVTANATATCVVTESPCIAVTKNCDTVAIGSGNTISGLVSNCGNVALTNIVLTDNLYGQVAAFVSLAPGASQSYSKLVTNSTCGSFPNTMTATGRSVCGTPVQATANATCSVTCAPKICVTKEVACELPTGCGSFSDFATGAKSADNSQCPSFCYRVRVTNCGQEALNNVTVVDNVINLAGCNFPSTLAVNQTVECIVAGVEHCQNVTNTVTASGVGVFSGINVSTNDTAAVVVLPISITCNVTVNGKPHETIPCDGQGHLITNAVEVCNTGSLPLSDIAINAPDVVALGGDCTNVVNLRLSLLPGQCTNVVLCTDLVTCPPDCGLAFSNHIRITATVDQTLTNVCTWTRNESNQVVAVIATTECTATVECLPPPKRGCTPGFWKNCTIHWGPAGYRTDQSVSSVFSLGSCCTSLGSSSLLGALSFPGGSGVCGGAQILLRAAVAALLNGSSPEVDYPFTGQEVIGLVNAAFQSCDRATIIALATELDQDNNLGCTGANGEGLPCHRLADVPRAVPTKALADPRVAPTKTVDDPRSAPTRQ